MYKEILKYIFTGHVKNKEIKEVVDKFIDSDFGKTLYDYLIKNILKYLDELNNIENIIYLGYSDNTKKVIDNYLKEFQNTQEIGEKLIDFFSEEIVFLIRQEFYEEINENTSPEKFLILLSNLIKKYQNV